MSIAFPQAGFVRRLVGLLLNALERSRTRSAAAVAERPFQLPMLFAARTPETPRSSIDVLSFSRSRMWSFAARLRSVAGENVPKARKGPRARTTPPVGKAIPKKSPHALKRYKPGSGVPATAPWRARGGCSASRSSNVVMLTQAARWPTTPNATAQSLAA